MLQVFDDLDGAIGSGTLLIGGDQEADATRVLGVLSHEGLTGHQHGRQTAFHVGAAATEQGVVDQGGFKGRCVPLCSGAGGYHIRMAGEDQDGAITAAFGPEIAHLTKAQCFAGKTQCLQLLHHQRLAAGIFGGYGGPPDQFTTEREGLFHIGCPLSYERVIPRSTPPRCDW